MVETSTAEVLLALISFFGSSLADLPDRFDELVRVAAPIVYRENHMSAEELRLDRFWRDYYAAMGRFNNDLSKLDWVAFHKNHGQLVNGGDNGLSGGSSRIQFAPLVVVPRMEWSIPPGAKVSSAPPKPQNVTHPLGAQPSLIPPPQIQPVSPVQKETVIWWEEGQAGKPQRIIPSAGSNATPVPVSPEEERLQRFWNDYYESLKFLNGNFEHVDWVKYYKDHGYQIYCGTKLTQLAPAAPNSLVLHVKVAESQPSGVRQYSWVCQLGEFRAFRVHDANDLKLVSGTAKDLITPPESHEVVQAKLPDAQAVSIGTTLAGQVTPITDNRVRLDLTLTTSDVESAGKDNVLIASKTYRLAQQLLLGRQTKIVLQADAAGEPRAWLEVVIRQGPVQAGTAENMSGCPTPGPVCPPPGTITNYPPIPWGSPIPDAHEDLPKTLEKQK